jgi:hypothetical protein
MGFGDFSEPLKAGAPRRDSLARNVPAHGSSFDRAQDEAFRSRRYFQFRVERFQ